MAVPRVFVSSTYIDLVEVRARLAGFFTEIGFEAKLFERGGVYFDPSKPLDESCINEVRNSDLFILVIGGRYGSPVTADQSKNAGQRYNSVTKAEYLAARDKNIPVYTFVKSQVNSELATYRKVPADQRDGLPYAHVDDIQIFKLLEDIYQANRGNQVFKYETADDITKQLRSQLVGMWSEYLRGKQRSSGGASRVRLNAYKMFFHRTQQSLSFGDLSKRSGVARDQLRRLERVRRSVDSLDPSLFQLCDQDVLTKIENTLGCAGELSVGKHDDFLSIYIQYFATYKGKKKVRTRSEFTERQIFPTRAVVFDFDGTLTLRKENLTTWERIWLELGYDVNECAAYLRQFSDKKISHKKWCDLTCEKFRERGLTSDQVLHIAEQVKLVPGTAETIRILREEGIALYILSGSIRQVIKHVLGDLWDHFDEVKANDIIFDKDGVISAIRGTRYDFEGKADYLKEVIHRHALSPLEVLFVGNSCNDVWASRSGARTLCVNPHFTDPNIALHWSYCLRQMDDLRAVLEFTNISRDA
jgi:HAD superfamily phosphoserine phosphatase-like hydrolase